MNRGRLQLGAAMAATALLAFGASASAATVPATDAFAELKSYGPLAITPASGNLETPIDLTTGGGCPQGDSSITRLYGKGLPADGENVIGNTYVRFFNSPPEDRMVAPMTITLAEAARRQAKPVNLDGDYVLRFSCQMAMPPRTGGLFGVYVGKLRIKGDSYTAVTTSDDLPEVPTPKAGSDALNSTPPPPPVPDPALLQDAANTSAEASAESSDTAIALAATAGVLVVGLGAALVVQRRSRARSS